jgi:hypothetical protein
MPTPAAHHPTGPILARSEDALVFVGHRTPTTCTVTIGGPLVPRAPLDPRLELVDHSTTGFEWGYSGWELDADDVRAQIEQFERGAHA